MAVVVAYLKTLFGRNWGGQNCGNVGLRTEPRTSRLRSKRVRQRSLTQYTDKTEGKTRTRCILPMVTDSGRAPKHRNSHTAEIRSAINTCGSHTDSSGTIPPRAYKKPAGESGKGATIAITATSWTNRWPTCSEWIQRVLFASCSAHRIGTRS
jgi:hypothetical protein